MTNKLTDAQIALFRSVRQRADHCIVAPTGKTAGVKKLAARMIDIGWLKEIKARAGAPVWRTDEASGAAYALKLTAAGLKAFAAVERQVPREEATPTAPGGDEGEGRKEASALRTGARQATPAQPNFREGSKLAAVMKLLQRDGGVTVDELSAAMSWAPHSTRAVLTGLRKRGVVVARRKTPDKNASAYFIESDCADAIAQG